MLIGNGRLIDKLPMSFLGRDGLNNLQPGVAVSSTLADSFGALAAMPDGYYQPQGWMLPRKAGAMASRNTTEFSLALTGLAVGGITTDATATIAFAFASAAGQLISSGSGAAAMTFAAANALLTASLNGVGSAAFTVATNTPTLGAEASGAGAASFAITSTLSPYAIGSMSGSTVDAGTLTTASLIAAMNASPPAVNIKLVNDVAITGTGAVGDEWGP
jgi:hypothetical protein